MRQVNMKYQVLARQDITSCALNLVHTLGARDGENETHYADANHLGNLRFATSLDAATIRHGFAAYRHFYYLLLKSNENPPSVSYGRHAVLF